MARNGKRRPIAGYMFALNAGVRLGALDVYAAIRDPANYQAHANAAAAKFSANFVPVATDGFLYGMVKRTVGPLPITRSISIF
jgi:hypothetical protein